MELSSGPAATGRAAGLGAWLLAEEVSALLLLGLACVVLGLWLAHRPGEGAVESRSARPEGAR